MSRSTIFANRAWRASRTLKKKDIKCLSMRETLQVTVAQGSLPGQLVSSRDGPFTLIHLPWDQQDPQGRENLGHHVGPLKREWRKIILSEHMLGDSFFFSTWLENFSFNGRWIQKIENVKWGSFLPLYLLCSIIFFYKLFQQCSISHPSNYIYFKWGWRTQLPGDFNVRMFLSLLTLYFLCWDRKYRPLWERWSSLENWNGSGRHGVLGW